MRGFRIAVVIIMTVLAGSLMAQSDRPFVLPVASPPGTGTWLFGQAYGNTIGAYLQGSNWYEAGQRLHFGLDLSMPCGTEIVAVGDGTVAFVDDLGFGSGPHNLLIRHDAEGVISLYGHLLARPALNPGDVVTRGQVVGVSGDPDLTCQSRPHLHLEIRSLDYFTTYNPLDYIDANAHALAIAGPFRFPLFQQDLDNARRWMDLYDQPNVTFGGPPLNGYAATVPDLSNGEPPANPPLDRTLPAPGRYEAIATTADGCCRAATWDPSLPDSLAAVDGAPGQRAGLLRWDWATAQWVGNGETAPLPYASPDATHTVTLDNGGPARITRRSDGVTWLVDTQGAWPAISPDNRQLLWLVTPDGTSDEPKTEIWIANVDGSNARAVAAENGTFGQWLDAERLLLGRRVDITTALGVFNTTTNELTLLGQWNWLRGLSVGPSGKRLLFYTVWDENNGLYTMETTAPGAQAMRLPWFGGWRWRDADSVYLAPLDPQTGVTALQVANLATGEAVPLDVQASFLIANGDWSVSPDGGRVALFNALDGRTWILEPAAENQP